MPDFIVTNQPGKIVVRIPPKRKPDSHGRIAGRQIPSGKWKIVHRKYLRKIRRATFEIPQ